VGGVPAPPGGPWQGRHDLGQPVFPPRQHL